MKKLSLNLTFLVLIIFLWSCKDNFEEPVSINNTQTSVTIEEAKEWYESRKKGFANSRLSDKLSNSVAFWEYAVQGKLANGVEVITVPLLYNSHPLVSVSGDEKFSKDGDTYLVQGFDYKSYQIQSKMLISKDENGHFRSEVIAIIPEQKDQRNKKPVKKETFSGAVLLMEEDGINFKRGWKYKNGKLKDVFTQNKLSPNARLSAYSCSVAFYGLMAQGSGSGNYTCSPSSDRNCFPSSFIDQATGGFWVKIFEREATCEEGVPTGAPYRQNPWDQETNWVMANPTGGGGAAYPYQDPYAPSQIDYGMPIELDAADAFAWELANRIGTRFFLNGEEIELMRSNYWLTFKVREYIEATGQKPNLSGFIINVETSSDQQMIEAINILVEGPGVPSGLTPRELELLGLGTSSFRVNLNKYYYDARTASLRAINRYNFSQAILDGISRANAFKHALFVIMHAKSFGRSLAQELANAHENYDVNRSPAEYSLDVQMDLWNNQEGFNVFDANPNSSIDNFDSTVFNKVTNGHMRYIYNNTLVPTF
jgi:hypothetical protein